MESNEEVVCSDLPQEIVDRVLSFLPVPSLCRCRSVCKRWNELTRMPAFHDLCDLNGTQKHGMYLFVTRYLVYLWTDSDGEQWWRFVDSLRRPLSIFDLEMNRWYTIPTHAYSRGAPRDDFGTRFLAMDDGLICELTGRKDPVIVISDFVAATRTELPPTPVYWSHFDEPLPVIASAVDPISRTYKIVVIISVKEYPRFNRTCVYEQSTNAWRVIASHYMTAVSAVFFHDVLYVVYDAMETYTLQTLTLDPREDKWSDTTVTIPPGHLDYPRLVVSGGHLCMMQWIPTDAQARGMTPWRLGTPDESFHPAQSTSVLEIVEIVVGSEHHGTKNLVLITSAQLWEWFDEPSDNIAYAIPVVDDSSGDCRSVVLMSKESGKMVRRDLVSGAVEVLPEHPFGAAPDSSPLLPNGVPVHPYYVGKLMNLMSLRSLTL